MSSQSSGNHNRPLVVTPRLKLYVGDQWRGSAQVAPPDSAVLGGEPSMPDVASSLSIFSPAEPAIELEIPPAAAVLGEEEAQAATLEYQPQEQAAYALLQTITTPEGVIYDFTLPEAVDDGGVVLGAGDVGTLRFPVNPLVFDTSTPPDGQGAVLGFDDFVGGLVGGELGGVVLKRVVQVIKSPLESAMLQAIRQAEGEPWVGVLRDPAASFEPISGFEQWRTLLPPGGERRVLLFVHGFSSSLGEDNQWLGELGQGYDAILGYNHPTIWCDPEHNARELLAMIPSDLRLSVDIVAHSRGGLVSRSLVELVEPIEAFKVRRIVTNGTPHGGTRLADPQRWDRLVSIGMTAASVLGSTLGAAAYIPKALELVLKAASQVIFDLPGVGAMTPSGTFIAKINSSPEDGSAIAQAQEYARYSAITSQYSMFGASEPAFRQALRAFAAQTFFDAANDLVVPTESMSMLDRTGLIPKERQILVGIDHFSYFHTPEVLAFMRQQLAD